MKHICIIGGTGMLAEVTKWYADNNSIVSVIARNEEKMNRMKSACSHPENIKAIYVDYRDSTKLHQSLKLNIKEYGPLVEAVVWLHADGLEALPILFDLVEEKSKVWQVIGSKANAEQLRKQFDSAKGFEYNHIQLGCVKVNNQQIWLTNLEIATGVIRSIQSNRSYSLVGELPS